MTLKALDHVNIRTANLDEMRAWYRDVLGMEEGPRPDFDFPGAWLYAGAAAAVHLVGVGAQPAGREPRIEHFAFSASGFADFTRRLRERGVAHSVDPVPGFPVIQVNLRDCDGNHIHVDFAEDEVAKAR